MAKTNKYGFGSSQFRVGHGNVKGTRFQSSQAGGVRYTSPEAHRAYLSRIQQPAYPFHEVAGGSYWEITNAIERKMNDIKRNLNATIRENLSKGNGAAQTRVQSTTPRISAKRSSDVAAALDPRYSGGEPKSRLSGKGRSTSVSRLIDPSYEYQFGDPADRRLSSIGGIAGEQRFTAGSLTSRFNNKGGNGLMGASASRLRGGKNLLAHPETWLKRYAAYWLVSETSNAFESWRGWDRVSFDMTNSQAKDAMGDPAPVGRLPVALGGKMTSAVMGLASPLVTAGIAWFGMPFSAVSQAKAKSYYNAFGQWADNGFYGKNPVAALEDAQIDAKASVLHAKKMAMNAATTVFHQNITDGLSRVKDTLALRGVGGVFGVSGMGAKLADRPDFQSMLDILKKSAANGVNEKQIMKEAFNRHLQQFK